MTDAAARAAVLRCWRTSGWLLLAISVAACRPVHTVPAAMPDLSGLAALAGDTLLVVHDAKRHGETQSPRVGIIQRSDSSAGPTWTPLEIDWPEEAGLSNDLESIAPIPGERAFLFVESGDDGSEYRRIFRAGYHGGLFSIDQVVDWPVPVFNVEGSAVARVGGAYVFIYAERADDRSVTQISWARFEPDSMQFGRFSSVPLSSPEPKGAGARANAALEVDHEGRIYSVSSYDPDREEGPFWSAVWLVGKIVPEGEEVVIQLLDTPVRLVRLPVSKAEALAITRETDGNVDLVVGVDDEQFGGALCALSLRSDSGAHGGIRVAQTTCDRPLHP